MLRRLVQLIHLQIKAGVLSIILHFGSLVTPKEKYTHCVYFTRSQ